jgi:hypothetical protein
MFVPKHGATIIDVEMVPVPAEVVEKILGPRILPFRGKPVERQPKNFAQCVNEEFAKEAANAEGVVILYRTKDGQNKVLSDQGDIAATLLFVEKAKQAFLR